jgi:hypothetical protein
VLVTGDQVKSETWMIPYLEPWNDLGMSKIAIYVNGFDLYTRPSSYPNNSF